MKRFFWAGIAFGVFAAPAARADLVVRCTQQRGPAGAAPLELQVSVAPTRLAVEVLGPAAPTQARYVYRADLGVLWTVLPLWKAYVQQDSVTEIAARTGKGGTPQDAEERILARPPAERAQAEAEEAARREAAARRAQFQFVDTGKREQVAGVECALWVATGGPADSTAAGPEGLAWRDEVWVAPWAVLGAGDAIPEAVLDFSRTAERWWHGTPVHGGVLTLVRALPALGGCPIRFRHFAGPDLVSEYLFGGARLRDVTPGLYVIPPGFVRREG